MKVAYELLILMLCANLGVWYVNERAVLPRAGVNTPVDPDDLSSWLNATETAQGWSGWAGTSYYVVGDVPSGINFLFRLFSFTLAGMPLFLSNLGASTELISMFTVVVSAIWIISTVQFISGRRLHD